MSCFLGANAASVPQVGIGPNSATDDRAMRTDFRWSHLPYTFAAAPWRDGNLWSGSRSLGGGFYGGSLTGDAVSDGSEWEPIGGSGWDSSGGQQQKKIIGQTLDSTGAALGNVVVKGFVTATAVFEGQVTSDTAGYYELPCQYPGNHWIDCYKAGSPDVAGTSVNTLVPV